MFEVEQCPGDLSYLAPEGFKLENHDLLLLGLCVDCVGGTSKKKAPTKAPPRLRPAGDHTHGHDHSHPHTHRH
jgi:Fur family ferric uptake transcriptional regulator